jgi:membrane-associated phospholipid phosphatase
MRVAPGPRGRHTLALTRIGPLCTALALAAARARAAEPPLPLRYDLATDLSVTAAAVASMAALGVLKPRLASLQCRICAPDVLDDSVQRAVVWSDPQVADTWSGIVANAVLPAALLGYGLVSASAAGDVSAGAVDALFIVEAVSFATILQEAAKYGSDRLRPYAWYGHLSPRPGAYDQNLSFYSGHTSFAFATATSAGTIFMMRGYPGAPVVLGVGLAAAAGVGYLRMAADTHYLTDVLAGAAVGGFVGFAVPWFFHRPRGAAPQPGDLFPAPGGIAIAW